MNEVEIEEIAALVANGVDPQTIAKYRNATSADQKMIDRKAEGDRDAKEDPRPDGLT
ncbi:MAG: hypothetical protein ACRYG8_22025 [Janthinobacterium lividum]